MLLEQLFNLIVFRAYVAFAKTSSLLDCCRHARVRLAYAVETGALRDELFYETCLAMVGRELDARAWERSRLCARRVS